MSGNLDIKWTSDETEVTKAQDKLIKQLQETVEKYKKMAAEAKTSGKEMTRSANAAARELDRFAKATKDINRTPLEKYADTMRQLDQALKAGKIDQETFNRAVAKAKTEFQQAGDAGKRAFGPGAAGGLTSYAERLMRVASAASAAAMAHRVFSAARQEAEEIGQKQFTEAPSLGMLAQVADTPEDLARLEGEVKKTFAEGGARTIPEAAALQFALESGEAGNLRADFSQLQASGLVPNATMMAESAIKLIAGMGEKETGDFRTVVSKAFGGAKLGLGSAEELLQATAKVSAQASRLGLSDEEVMAALSTVSAIEGPAEAETQIQALLKGIEVEGIGGGYLEKGKTLREQVARLKELEAAGEDIRDMLGGRQEAVKGYGQLVSERGVASVEANLANIAAAEQEDWFGQKVEMAEAIPSNRAAILARQRKNRAELAQEEVGIYENLADTMEYEQKEFKRRQYGGGFLGDVAAAAEGIGIAIHRKFGGNRQFIESGLNAGVSEETRAAAAQVEAAMELRDAAERLSQVAPDLTNAARANAAAVGGAVEAR